MGGHTTCKARYTPAVQPQPLEAPELHTFGQTKQMMHNSRQTRLEGRGAGGRVEPKSVPQRSHQEGSLTKAMVNAPFKVQLDHEVESIIQCT